MTILTRAEDMLMVCDNCFILTTTWFNELSCQKPHKYFILTLSVYIVCCDRRFPLSLSSISWDWHEIGQTRNNPGLQLYCLLDCAQVLLQGQRDSATQLLDRYEIAMELWPVDSFFFAKIILVWNSLWLFFSSSVAFYVNFLQSPKAQEQTSLCYLKQVFRRVHHRRRQRCMSLFICFCDFQTIVISVCFSFKVGYLRACCDSENYYEAEDATVTVTAGDDDGFSSFCVQTTDDDSSEQEEISIDCGTDSVIESLFFACYGNPSGSCSGDPFSYNGTKFSFT